MALTKVTESIIDFDTLKVGTTATGGGGLVLSESINLTFSSDTTNSYANLFRQKSSAATVLAQGYKYSDTSNAFASSIGSSWAKTAISQNYGTIRFYTDAAATTAVGTDVTPTERMRISSDGDLLLGKTSRTSSVTYGGAYILGDVNAGSTNYYAQMYIEHDSATNHGIVIDEIASGGSGIAMAFRSGSTVVGTVTVTSSSTTYNTSSDHRLKENVVDMTGAITRVKQLQPRRFNFIADADTTVDGFVAHEASTVVPEAVTGTHNETKTAENVVLSADGNVFADGVTEDEWTAGKTGDNPKFPSDSTWTASHTFPVYQGIDQSKLVPLLTGALKEAITKIEALETRIETLENA